MKWLLLPLCLTAVLVTTEATPDPIRRKDLLDGYDRLALPYSSTKKGTTVFLPSITLNHFTIDEEEQTFELQTWMHFSWEDERLKWSSDGNESDSKAGHLHFTPDEIWIPDVTLYNNAQPSNLNFYGKTDCLVASNGTVLWVPPTKFVAYCDLNLRKWPKDTQTCQVKIGSWTYHENELNMKFGTEEVEGVETEKVKIQEELSKEDNEWELLDTSAERISKRYECCEDNYVSITYEFTLQRRSSNYTYTVVLPIVLISLLNLILFLLPTTSGGRITLGAVNFLILSIFLIFFRSRLPNVDHVPYIVMLYGWNLVLVAVSILTAAIVSNLSRIVGTSSPPQCLRPIYNSSLMAVLCLGHLLEPNTNKRTPATATNRNSFKQGNRSVEDPLAEDLSDGTEGSKKSEWVLLAATIDRISFFAYTTITLVLLACFL